MTQEEQAALVAAQKTARIAGAVAVVALVVAVVAVVFVTRHANKPRQLIEAERVTVVDRDGVGRLSFAIDYEAGSGDFEGEPLIVWIDSTGQARRKLLRDLQGSR